MKTPCIQAFLHVLPAIGLLWGLVEVAPLTVGLAKGVALSAAVTALQASPCCRHLKCSVLSDILAKATMHFAASVASYIVMHGVCQFYSMLQG